MKHSTHKKRSPQTFVALNNNCQKFVSRHLIFYLPHQIAFLIIGQLAAQPFISLEILVIFWMIVPNKYFTKVSLLKKCCLSINPNLWLWLCKKSDVNERKRFLIMIVTIILLWHPGPMNLNQWENKTIDSEVYPVLLSDFNFALCAMAVPAKSSCIYLNALWVSQS